ncbi:MAG: hypothetical protein KDJ68_11920 [Rhodobiaceae bacterium]|nr:hypothetical protein [Rhodobiaceae bacterium]
MSLRSTLLGIAMLAIGASAALAADTVVTGKVANWDAENGVLTFADKSEITGLKGHPLMPADVKVGDTIVLSYTGTDNGVENIVSIEIRK